MNIIKKYGLETLIVAMFFLINVVVIVYYNGEIKAEKNRIASNNATANQVVKNAGKDDGKNENKDDDNENKEEVKSVEKENKSSSDIKQDTSKEPEAVVEKEEKPKPKPAPKKKKKVKKDKYYEIIKECYELLNSRLLNEYEMYELVYDLDDEIPEGYKLRYYKGVNRPKREVHDMTQVLINEISARNGQKFKSELKNFYKKQNWYRIRSDEAVKRKIESNYILHENYELLSRIRNNIANW